MIELIIRIESIALRDWERFGGYTVTNVGAFTYRVDGQGFASSARAVALWLRDRGVV